MPYSVTLPDGYGYAALVSLGVIPVLATAQAMLVTNLRHKAKIPYPNAYATHQQAKETAAAHRFNCAQRSHGQLLENMPQTMLSVLFAGLEYPQLAAGLGGAWVACRVIYAWGYITRTDPRMVKGGGEGRYYGIAFWLAQGGLWGLCIAAALRML